MKELAKKVFKQALSRLHHHSPNVDLHVIGKPIKSPADERAAEEAVARYVSSIVKGCSRRDASSSAGEGVILTPPFSCTYCNGRGAKTMF